MGFFFFFRFLEKHEKHWVRGKRRGKVLGFFWLYCRFEKSMKIRIMVGLIKICVNMDEEKSREKQGKTKGRGRGGKKRREKSQLSETHISPTLTSTAWCLLTFAIFFFQIALSGIMVLVGVLCSYFNTIVSALIINFVD